MTNDDHTIKLSFAENQSSTFLINSSITRTSKGLINPPPHLSLSVVLPKETESIERVD